MLLASVYHQCIISTATEPSSLHLVALTVMPLLCMYSFTGDLNGCLVQCLSISETLSECNADDEAVMLNALSMHEG